MALQSQSTDYVLIEYVYINKDIEYCACGDTLFIPNVTKFKPKSANITQTLSSPIVILQTLFNKKHEHQNNQQTNREDAWYYFSRMFLFTDLFHLTNLIESTEHSTIINLAKIKNLLYTTSISPHLNQAMSESIPLSPFELPVLMNNPQETIKVCLKTKHIL